MVGAWTTDAADSAWDGIGWLAEAVAVWCAPCGTGVLDVSAGDVLVTALAGAGAACVFEWKTMVLVPRALRPRPVRADNNPERNFHMFWGGARRRRGKRAGRGCPDTSA